MIIGCMFLGGMFLIIVIGLYENTITDQYLEWLETSSFEEWKRFTSETDVGKCKSVRECAVEWRKWNRK